MAIETGMPARFALTVLIDQDGPYWVARCVELDILTSHIDRESALQDIVSLCRAQFMYALEKDCVHGLFRPIRPELSWKVAQAHEEGTPIALQINTIAVSLRQLAA